MVEDHETEVLFRLHDRGRGRGGDLGLEAGELVEHDIGAEDEIARVPQVAVLDERARALFVRLLHESLDPPHAGVDRERLSRVNVAVAGRRVIRRDAEGDDFAGRRDVERLSAQPGKLLSVLKDVVGCEHSHDRLRIAGRRPGGRGADRGRAVTPLRLEQDRRLGADLPQLLGDPKAIVEIGDDDRRIEHRRIANHADDRLKRRTLADQGNELLRQAFARFRPHAGARSAAHDHRQDFGHSCPRTLASGVRNRLARRVSSAIGASPRQCPPRRRAFTPCAAIGRGGARKPRRPRRRR